jgi:hypothetical protein
MTVMHFALLAFVVIKLACCCCAFRPEGSHSQCRCDQADVRLVTREELRDLLRQAAVNHSESP